MRKPQSNLRTSLVLDRFQQKIAGFLILIYGGVGKINGVGMFETPSMCNQCIW